MTAGQGSSVPAVEVSSETGSVPEAFLEIAERHALRPAVSAGADLLTYSDLAQRSAALAAAITAAGLTDPARIGIVSDQDAGVPAAMLGILRAGHAYVPLDPRQPVVRLGEIARQASLSAIVAGPAQIALARTLSASDRPVIGMAAEASPSAGPRAAALRPRRIDPQALAYILYTSGSTGTPKGVRQSHRNLLGHVAAYRHALAIGPADRLSFVSAYSFDAAVLDTFASLLSGALLCPFDVRRDGLEPLVRALRAGTITVFHSTPTLFRYVSPLLAEEGRVEKVRAVVLGGEEVLATDLERFKEAFADPCRFVNLYGTTEYTLATMSFLTPAARLSRRSVPIGRAVAGSCVLLLDQSGRPAEVYGEIACDGERAALGAAQGALYRTGDMARSLPCGELEFRGRRDAQLKVRGFRVEPGEIEACLRDDPAVKDAAVTARLDPRGEARLVAYVVLDPSATAASVRERVASRLPDYMVPAQVAELPEMPLTRTRKVDRSRLPEVDWRQAGAFAEPPVSDLERRLASIWSDLLGVDVIGRHDDVFELGAHSLTAIQATSRLREALHQEVPVRLLFERRTIAALAQALGSKDAPAPPAATAIPRRPRVLTNDRGRKKA